MGSPVARLVNTGNADVDDVLPLVTFAAVTLLSVVCLLAASLHFRAQRKRTIVHPVDRAINVCPFLLIMFASTLVVAAAVINASSPQKVGCSVATRDAASAAGRQYVCRPVLGADRDGPSTVWLREGVASGTPADRADNTTALAPTFLEFMVDNVAPITDQVPVYVVRIAAAILTWRFGPRFWRTFQPFTTKPSATGIMLIAYALAALFYAATYATQTTGMREVMRLASLDVMVSRHTVAALLDMLFIPLRTYVAASGWLVSLPAAMLVPYAHPFAIQFVRSFTMIILSAMVLGEVARLTSAIWAPRLQIGQYIRTAAMYALVADACAAVGWEVAPTHPLWLLLWAVSTYIEHLAEPLLASSVVAHDAVDSDEEDEDSDAEEQQGSAAATASVDNSDLTRAGALASSLALIGSIIGAVFRFLLWPSLILALWSLLYQVAPSTAATIEGYDTGSPESVVAAAIAVADLEGLVPSAALLVRGSRAIAGLGLAILPLGDVSVTRPVAVVGGMVGAFALASSAGIGDLAVASALGVLASLALWVLLAQPEALEVVSRWSFPLITTATALVTFAAYEAGHLNHEQSARDVFGWLEDSYLRTPVYLLFILVGVPVATLLLRDAVFGVVKFGAATAQTLVGSCLAAWEGLAFLRWLSAEFAAPAALSKLDVEVSTNSGWFAPYLPRSIAELLPGSVSSLFIGVLSVLVAVGMVNQVRSLLRAGNARGDDTDDSDGDSDASDDTGGVSPPRPPPHSPSRDEPRALTSKVPPSSTSLDTDAASSNASMNPITATTVRSGGGVLRKRHSQTGVAIDQSFRAADMGGVGATGSGDVGLSGARAAPPVHRAPVEQVPAASAQVAPHFSPSPHAEVASALRSSGGAGTTSFGFAAAQHAAQPQAEPRYVGGGNVPQPHSGFPGGVGVSQQQPGTPVGTIDPRSFSPSSSPAAGGGAGAAAVAGGFGGAGASAGSGHAPGSAQKRSFSLDDDSDDDDGAAPIKRSRQGD